MSALCARDQEKLNDPTAWQNVFLDQVVKHVPAEERFAELCDDATGRPNAPLRLLLGMLILKKDFGWSDEELFEAVHFNLLVRRALGLPNLTDEVPVESNLGACPTWGDRSEEVGERGHFVPVLRRIVVLCNEKAGRKGPFSRFRSRFILSRTGS
ncbi:hypothetical protein G3480_02535 [Thiorhodococcus mannitoliphagus]|uniref:Transposase InsH N-terminal domain-containing protein n=1 Tax=Thiorhodococcus mannitoliphagus TaxID=329406 RepID=A0A6P1DMP7_9GAMM|nr:transposase [Thiorhodococcus mannitoliphagus]NEX19199.1 hypothetical protein [Thiorhodococcus mannitoliphagus]